MIHKLKNFDFVLTDCGIRVLTLTKDSFAYPEKTWVATVFDQSKRIGYSHGYYPKHPIGIKIRNYAKKIGYSAY